jgi:hypothetical protein
MTEVLQILVEKNKYISNFAARNERCVAVWIGYSQAIRNINDGNNPK